MESPSQQQRPRRSLRSVVPAPLRHGVVLFLILLVIEYFVVPEFVVAGKNLHILSRVNVVWVVLGVLAEAGALFSYALLTRTLLPKDGPGLSTVFRIDLSTTAIAHIIPAGSAGSAGLGYRLLTANNVKGSDAALAMATQGVGSAVVLNILLWCSLVISIPIAGFHPIYVTVALVGLLALVGIGVFVYTFTQNEPAATALHAIGRRIPRVGPDRLASAAHRISGSLRGLASNPEQLRQACTWAALNWILDAASLWSFIVAFGRFVDPIELFTAYGIANVLAVIPLTPGGLGVIDASAPLLLVSFGLTQNIATLGVLGWRLVNFWLPIPVGAGAYLSLQGPRARGITTRRDALRGMAVGPEPPPDREQPPPDTDADEPPPSSEE